MYGTKVSNMRLANFLLGATKAHNKALRKDL